MKKENKTKIIKLSIIAIVLIVLVLAVFLPLKFTGLLEKINSIEELKNVINAGGAYSYLIFFAIQFVQVTLIPIPAIVTTIAGTLVFGPWISFGLSYASIILASLVSFFMGRKFGRKVVVWVIGEEDTHKWEQKLVKGKYVFFLMMLFPIFPDDILCMVVGAVTTMTYKFFIITNLITRPINLFCICFFGSGQLIPFSGWGIPVWTILVAVGIVLCYLSIKYQSKIEGFILKVSNKLSKRNKNKETENSENNQN